MVRGEYLNRFHSSVNISITASEIEYGRVQDFPSCEAEHAFAGSVICQQEDNPEEENQVLASHKPHK